MICFRFIEYYVKERFEEMKKLDASLAYSKPDLWELLKINDSLLDEFISYIRQNCVVKTIKGIEYFKPRKESGA